MLFFNYRGTWGSAGQFSAQNAIDDVEAALAFVRSEDARSAYRVDSTRLALVGHSFGGFTAAMGAANDSGVRCLGFLAGANLGVLGRAVAADPAIAQGVREALGVAMHPTAGPVRGDLDAALAQLADRAEEFDLVERASSFGDRPVLLVAATNDVLSVKAMMHDPLVAALRAVDASAVTEVVFESDHYFSGQRIALARALVEWLSTRCWSN